MSSAYYIVVDRDIEGFDSFVNGKAVARESDRLAQLTQSIGLREINEFVSADPDDLVAMAEEFGVELPSEPQPEQWFVPEEGLAWISKLRDSLSVHPDAVDDLDAIRSDLAEYHGVLEQAKANGARWHFAVDF